MIYNSKASTFVKPDIVNLNIYIKSFKETVAEAVNDVNNKRQLLKDYIFDKKSYQTDSYHQNSLDLRKRSIKETYYIHITTNKTITDAQYNKLKADQKSLYYAKVAEKLLGYDASLSINFTLNYCDEVVDDLVSIFNMTTELDLKCTYSHSLSKDLVDTTMQSLYATCINEGIKNVSNIVNNIELPTSSNDKVFNLLNVMDPCATSTRYDGDFMMAEQSFARKCSSTSSSYEPEPIIMPELIKELFNNNIELTKSLDLKFEFA